MRRLLSTVFCSRRRGVSALVYGLLVGLVSVVALSAVSRSGAAGNSLFGTVALRLAGASGAAGVPAPTPVPPRNCQEGQASGVISGAGTFVIDPDGAASAFAPMTVSCDAGGWTLVLQLRDPGLGTAGGWGVSALGTPPLAATTAPSLEQAKLSDTAINAITSGIKQNDIRVNVIDVNNTGSAWNHVTFFDRTCQVDFSSTKPVGDICNTPRGNDSTTSALFTNSHVGVITAWRNASPFDARFILHVPHVGRGAAGSHTPVTDFCRLYDPGSTCGRPFVMQLWVH